jgi:glycosyltransferase involved in cell wall biosynthesis
MSRLRICFVCNEYPPGPHGGIGSSTQVLARGLAAAGHQVRVVGMYPADYPAADCEADAGVQVWRMRRSRPRWSWPWDRYRLFRAVAGWARRGEIDLVDVPDWEGWAAGWPRLPVPVIVRLCGAVSYFAAELGQKVRRTMFWLERSSLERADFWCSKSRYTADKTQALFGLRTPPRQILYNPIPLLGDGSSTPRDPHRVVFTGTLTGKKGIASLVRAWPRVLKACPASRLHVFGKDGQSPQGGSMQRFLESMLDGPLEATVSFHGHVGRSEVIEALTACRVAVFPSYAEAFANAPLEAMASGCPTIYSRRGSGPELMDDGVHGLLVDPDDPEAIATALCRVLGDDELACRLGRAGQDRVRERFSLERIVAENVGFYRSCMAEFHG